MGLCECDKDILKIQLDSETADISTPASGNFKYNLKFPVKRNNYKKIVLYVDYWTVQIGGLTDLNYVLNANNISELNSYNSYTKGNNSILATLTTNGDGVSRTTDFAITYQAPQTPIIINGIPNELDISITDLAKSGIDFSSSDNNWILCLRLECFY